MVCISYVRILTREVPYEGDTHREVPCLGDRYIYLAVIGTYVYLVVTSLAPSETLERSSKKCLYTYIYVHTYVHVCTYVSFQAVEIPIHYVGIYIEVKHYVPTYVSGTSMIRTHTTRI